ncbi:hypothetical protein F6X37_19225 [Paraburkholderia sp. 31.1]|uniref:hypothetical protein n=1 Tax=Paraburkholderia sp. 31.1 TaxID=2615205 RepID=UPI0016561CA9|nr:hypothetical protein [Paraburkholderia sp. 31.1]MBC8723632.1 hypothetical protein [Paraburkholderia sp. 31.1]
MTQIRSLLIGTALTAFAATAAVAQTAQPAAGIGAQPQIQSQGAADMAPPPARLTASGSTDPLVQKRDADAKANAEYRAARKSSKAELKAEQKAAKDQYKEQVRGAKLNQKADKQTANNEMKMNMEGQAATQGDGADVKH